MALANVDRCPYPRPISVKLTEKDELQNGMLIAIGEAKIEGNQELYEGKKPDGKLPVGIIVEPFHPYRVDEVEKDMVFKQGDIVRVYPRSAGDCFTISKEYVGTAKNANDPLKVKATAYTFDKETEAANAIAKVTRVYSFNGQDSVRVEWL